MAWLWHAMYPWAIPILKLRLRISVEGAEHIPKEGAALIASNHLSALDHVVLPAVTKRVIYNISKKEHFEKPFKAWFMRNVGVLRLDRGAGDTGALEKAEEIIRSGELFCIYPEGTRSPDGRLYKGRTGVARLALAAGVPVIPVAMIGTFEAKPKGHKGINKGVRTKAVVGEPLHFDKYHGKQDSRRVCRKVTDQIMAAIAELSGQEYVDDYAPNPVYDAKRKAAEAAKQDVESAPETGPKS